MTASHAQVTVTAAGPDIPDEQRGNVGCRFYRAAGTQAPASGLGLSIAQRIVDLHRHTLQLDTPPTGIGLRVVVTFPRAAA